MSEYGSASATKSRAADVLDARKLLDAAMRKTGLSDFGDTTLINRVAALASKFGDAFQDEAKLENARSVFHWLLTDRMKLFEDHKRLDIGSERILKPVIVTSETRTGTTFAQMLLGQDPHASLLKFWEVMHPSPPPSLAPADDPRRALADSD